ncbi:hypothetical protein PENTCL1PPCAC_3314, partial [Pristionchus entomophagus]
LFPLMTTSFCDFQCNGQHFTLHKLSEIVHSNPQCVLCEAHPSTVIGYTYHLKKHHKTTLRANGIYLLCACGTRINSEWSHNKHECKGEQFTIHKL